MSTKICNKCNKEYPRTMEYFYTQRRNKDGFVNHCKKCQIEEKREYLKEYYKKNREKLKKTSKEYYSENREFVLRKLKVKREIEKI